MFVRLNEAYKSPTFKDNARSPALLSRVVLGGNLRRSGGGGSSTAPVSLFFTLKKRRYELSARPGQARKMSISLGTFLR